MTISDLLVRNGKVNVFSATSFETAAMIEGISYEEKIAWFRFWEAVPQVLTPWRVQDGFYYHLSELYQ